MSTAPSNVPPCGHWLRLAQARFEARVLDLVAQHPSVPLALGNLAARGQVGAAHLHLSRHLPRSGARLSTLAAQAGMSKQAMAALVAQCEAWGMVERHPDPQDARARQLRFSPTGLAWLDAFEAATTEAEAELRAAVGDEVATVLALGLEAYAAR